MTKQTTRPGGPLSRGRSNLNVALRGSQKHSGVVDNTRVDDFIKGTFPTLFWTEVDPLSKLVVPTGELGQFAYTGIHRPVDNAHAQHPVEGGDAWNGDLTIKMRVRQNNNIGASAFIYMAAVLSEKPVHMGGGAGTPALGSEVGGFGFACTTPSTGDFYNFWFGEWGVGTGGGGPIMTVQLLPGTRGTTVYVKVRRIGDELYCDVYGNQDYESNLLGSNNVTLVKANADTLTTFFGFNSGIGGSGATHDLSFRYDQVG